MDAVCVNREWVVVMWLMSLGPDRKYSLAHVVLDRDKASVCGNRYN